MDSTPRFRISLMHVNYRQKGALCITTKNIIIKNIAIPKEAVVATIAMQKPNTVAAVK
ncbi:hypothetical protein D3C84_1032350 [compost metagenome]